MAFLLASLAVTFAVLLLAIGAARDPLTAPVALVMALFFSGLLGSTYAPNEDPDRLAARAHAWQIASMWASRLERAVDGGACRPDLALTISEDLAEKNLTVWTKYARSL